MDSQPTPVPDQRGAAATPSTQEECPPQEGSAGGLVSAFESCLHAEAPDEEMGEYIERPLARCQSCGGEMFELKSYRHKAGQGRLRFLCLGCGKRWYLWHPSWAAAEMKPEVR